MGCASANKSPTIRLGWVAALSPTRTCHQATEELLFGPNRHGWATLANLVFPVLLPNLALPRLPGRNKCDDTNTGTQWEQK